MSGAQSRLSKLVSHFLPSSASPTVPDSPGFTHRYNVHTLSPTAFLPRAAAIEPNAVAVYHETTNGQILRRTYQEVADRARGFAYYLKKHGFKKVGILCSNTPAFLEAIYGIAAADAVNVAINYRLKPSDLTYIFDHSDAEVILVDAEYRHLLDDFHSCHPNIPFIIDTDTDLNDGQYDKAVKEGLEYDIQQGGAGWAGLQAQAIDEESVIALAYTSGTTAKPKGVEFTHRGCYLAALGNIIESGLNFHEGRCHYLWTLPMFHAMGWTFPWAVTAVRGTHYCLRKIDYPQIWRLLLNEHITHFNAAPTVNTLLCNSPSAQRLPSPVRVTVAASPPTAHLFEQMTELNLHPVHVYGLTETYGPITKGYKMPEWEDIPVKEKYAKMARQGHGFVSSLPVRVVKTGEDVDPAAPVVDVARDGKEVGEIVFLGNICAKGYYKDPEATRKLYAGGVSHSGDLAVWHEDGAVQIIDRGKDIIISGGENISSLALESLIIQHPSVLECAVVAIQDEKWGERPKAFVTIKSSPSPSPSSTSPSPSQSSTSTSTSPPSTDSEAITSWIKSNPSISGFMVPREVEVVDELPKTSTGKVRKNVLREWARGGKRGEGGE